MKLTGQADQFAQWCSQLLFIVQKLQKRVDSAPLVMLGFQKLTFEIGWPSRSICQVMEPAFFNNLEVTEKGRFCPLHYNRVSIKDYEISWPSQSICQVMETAFVCSSEVTEKGRFFPLVMVGFQTFCILIWFAKQINLPSDGASFCL